MFKQPFYNPKASAGLYSMNGSATVTMVNRKKFKPVLATAFAIVFTFGVMLNNYLPFVPVFVVYAGFAVNASSIFADSVFIKRLKRLVDFAGWAAFYGNFNGTHRCLLYSTQ